MPDFSAMTGLSSPQRQRMLSLALALGGAMALQACSTVASVATAPVRVAGSGIDRLTTSQSEADEKRGREIRKREEELGRTQRAYEKHHSQCEKGDQAACEQAREDYALIQQLMPRVPYEGN